MKWFSNGLVVCLLSCLLLGACSSDKEEVLVDQDLNTELLSIEFPIMPSDTTLVTDSTAGKYEEPSSRAWEVLQLPKLYLISNYNSSRNRQALELKMSGSGESRSVRFCLFIRNGQLYATNKVDEIQINQNCILSSVRDRIVMSTQSTGLTTPAGNAVDEPYGDRLFRTEPFTVSYAMKGSTDATYTITYGTTGYSNESGTFQDASSNPLVFQLDRYTSKVRANLVITDYTLEYASVYTKWHFEWDTKTSMAHWSWMPFLTNVANTYDMDAKSASGGKIVPLLSAPRTFEDGNTVLFTGGILYTGIGKRFKNEEGYAYLLPQLNEGAKLCYSFYYKKGGKYKKYRASNTLEITLNNIVLDPNVENEITTIFHINDLIKAMRNKKSKSRADFVTHEDPNFGTLMEVPHKTVVTYK